MNNKRDLSKQTTGTERTVPLTSQAVLGHSRQRCKSINSTASWRAVLDLQDFSSGLMKFLELLEAQLCKCLLC